MNQESSMMQIRDYFNSSGNGFRVPQREDLERAQEDNLKDVFGRARHATHKDNLAGVGSFNKECRTLLVSRIKLDPS